jgi:hypothetical protein
MIYNEFEQRLYNCETLEEIVQLCVDNPLWARVFTRRRLLNEINYDSKRT